MGFWCFYIKTVRWLLAPVAWWLIWTLYSPLALHLQISFISDVEMIKRGLLGIIDRLFTGWSGAWKGSIWPDHAWYSIWPYYWWMAFQESSRSWMIGVDVLSFVVKVIPMKINRHRENVIIKCVILANRLWQDLSKFAFFKEFLKRTLTTPGKVFRWGYIHCSITVLRLSMS